MLIRMVASEEGNDKAIGLPITAQVPEQFAGCRMASRARQVALAGPLRLVQGGTGLVARLPVYLHDRGQMNISGASSVGDRCTKTVRH